MAKFRQIVRIAALTHDLGHCAFSHVSERFYEQLDQVKEAAALLGKYYKHSVSASETLSILIVKSPAFQKLLEEARVTPTGVSPAQLADDVAACIAGSVYRLHPACFLAEMVNGVIDCDKLDYLPRDAHLAGVPISLDVDRLYSKLRLAEKEAKDGRKTWVLAIEASGIRALEELLATRIFMYDKFYYHHKVMAAEELVRRAFRKLAEAIPEFGTPSTLLGYGDDELLSVTPESLGYRYDIDPDHKVLQEACVLFGRVRWRNLPKRAFAFARRFIPEPPDLYAYLASRGRPDQLNWGNTDYELVSDFLEEDNSKDIYVDQIRQYAKELGAGSDIEVFIGMQPPRRASGSLDVPVINRDGKAEKKPAFLFEGSKWSDAYALNKQTSFVFADGQLPIVHLAAERALAERRLFFPPSSWMLAKMDRGQIDAERTHVPDSDDWRPFRLAPDYLYTAAAKERIDALKGKFASLLNTALIARVGPALIENWLWQLLDPSLQDTALSLLEYVTFFEKRDVVDGFAAIISRDASLRECLWVPLRPSRGPGGSADQLTYDLSELGIKAIPLQSITEKESRGSKGIVLYDDTLNSGVQCSCLLASWFDRRELCKNPKDADERGPQSAGIQTILRSAKIRFAFHTAHDYGRRAVTEVTSSLGLDLREIVARHNTANPEFNLQGFSPPITAEGSRLVAYLQDRGERLLRQLKPWPPEQCSAYALGYAGLKLTVAYHHRVSTGLPVAMWAFNKDPMDVWLPVLPRDPGDVSEALRPPRVIAK